MESVIFVFLYQYLWEKQEVFQKLLIQWANLNMNYEIADVIVLLEYSIRFLYTRMFFHELPL